MKKKRNTPQKIDPGKTISSGRRWCFRLVALLIPLFILVLLEFALRLAGYGYPTHFLLTDSLNEQKVLRDNQKFGWRFFPRAIARTTRPVVLAPVKPPHTCRIYVFGESAAFGDPSPAFGLPRVLEVLLRNRYSTVHFEVVNAAMTAINSNVILPIARDCAKGDGDVWVLYMGNNEVVGPYGGGTVFGPQVPSLEFIRASIWFKGTRIGQLMGSLREMLANKNSGQPSNVSLELFLDQKIRRDDPRMEKVYAHFVSNLSDILKMGAHAGVKLVVSTVAVNLKDCAPFASQHRTDLTREQEAEFDRLYRAGINAEQARKMSEAMEAYSQADKLDSHWADLQFGQARLLWAANQFADALQHFTLARDDDALRFRADSRLNDIIRRSSTNRLNEGIAFLDGEAVLAQHSPRGVAGGELFYEHVHLNFTGNYWLARSIAEQITDVLKPPALDGHAPVGTNWLSEQECAAQLALSEWDHCQTLEIVRQRLEGPPFTLQLNHEEQRASVQKQLAEFRSALSPQTMTDSTRRCEQALTLNPNDWALHQKLAQLLQESPDKTSARAIEEWQRVVALVPHYPEAHFGLGILLDRAGKTSEAEAEFRLALKLNNYYPNALNALGHVLATQNRLAEAIANYEKAIQLKPHFPDALVNLGEALARLGKKADAKARFEDALRLAPGNTDAAASLGKLLDEKGEVSAAIARYSEILRATPENALAHYNLGRCLAFLGRSREAGEQYAEAVRLQPDLADAHSDLALELAKSGKESEAMPHFREAVRLQPDSAVFHKSLGVALARQHHFEDAAKEFEAALRLDPNDTAAQQFLLAARRSGTRADH